jgi:hypothetical protein
MGTMKQKCSKCGVDLNYEYKDDDTDLGKFRLGHYLCFACMDKSYDVWGED